jgi:hypothetical protein
LVETLSSDTGRVALEMNVAYLYSEERSSGITSQAYLGIDWETTGGPIESDVRWVALTVLGRKEVS